MAWIQSHQTLSDHPKTRKLTRLLGTSKAATIGHLHCLWWWAFDYAPDGDLDRFDAMDIAIAAEWDGDPAELIGALVNAGFLDRAGDLLTLHDWDQYGGKLHAKREADAERKRLERRGDGAKNPPPSNGCPSDIQRPSHVEESRREESKEISNDISLGDADAPAKTTRAKQCPEDFAITDAIAAWGEENGYTRQQMELQALRFVDHYRSKGEARKDWVRSFYNWMRNAESYGQLGSLTVHRGGQAGPPGVPLLPGEVATEISPGHWELNGRDGFKRIIRPDYYGVIFDQRKHQYDGYASFVRDRQEAERRAHEQEQIA